MLNIILLITFIVLLTWLVVNKFIEHARGKVVLESKMSQLSVDKTYTVIYKPTLFRKVLWEIKPKEEHTSIMTESTYYNNRIDVTVNVYSGSIVVYSVYLKNVIQISEE